MRHLTTSILLTLAVLLGSAGESFALPECPGSPTKSLTLTYSWNNCQGTVEVVGILKYVGEYKDGKQHGQGSYTYPIGDKYVGEWKDDKEHGQGTLYFLADNQFKGDKYVGEFKDGKPHGQGTFTYGSKSKWAGDKYVGEVKYGKKHGQGTYTYADGNKYVGEFKDDKFNGQGTYTYADGRKYVGEWKDGLLHGQGTATHADGRIKEGIWENGDFKYAQKITPTVIAKKTPPPSKGEGFALPECPGSPKTGSISIVRSWNNCKGTYTHTDGDKYVGEWKDGNKHGQGIYTFADGNKYVGEYKDGKPHGQGTLTSANGDKYVGEWKDGEFTGQGTLTDADGRKYVGEWKDFQFHGQGTLTFASGAKYVGEWKDGEFTGQGTLTSANGNKYVGEFKDDKKHGQGTYTHATGIKYVGEFKDDTFTGQGTVTYTDGDKYVGEFKDFQWHGQGTYTSAYGNKYVGEWKDGNKHGQGIYTFADGRIKEGIWENDEFKYAKKVTPTVTAKKTPEPSSQVKKELEELRKKIARLEKEKKQKPKPKRVVKKKTQPKPAPKSATSGSGFFISKKGHVITNQHIVNKCKEVTVGDNAQKQVTADVLETDRSNDLALLRISSTKMASADTKSLISKLGITVVPLASDGLLRSEDVELGEDVLVSGYPYGDIFSNTIKVTKGIVSANRGFGDDTGQFQMDAAVQPGNSGGPIYDENGNIVGVVVSQLNKMKFAKATGSMPENVNFGIKASTVRQFLNSAGLPTKWSKRSKRMSTKQLAKIAKNQTVMVVCHP